MKFTIIGSALAGNKGAASMLESSIQTISKMQPESEFVLLSVYPDEDSKLNTYKNLTILPASTLTVGLVLNPLALLYKLIPPARNYIISKSPQLKAIHDSDAYLDQGGITFTDGREVFLIYNVASVLPAILMGKKVIKCSQAMGPFNNIINRTTAKWLLPKIEHIFARGSITYENLKKLGLKNVSLAADYAFLLEVVDREAKEAKRLLEKNSYKTNVKNIGVFPSEVMRKKFVKKETSYEEIMADFIDKIANKNRKIFIFPHSQRSDMNKRHNNDIPVCESIYGMVKNKKNVIFVRDSMTAQQLRESIGAMDINVAARFHAMVSSLACGIPVVVTGWNHKYQEVLDMFDIKESAIKTDELESKTLVSLFEKNYKELDRLSKKIKSHISSVKQSSMNNTKLTIEICNKNR